MTRMPWDEREVRLEGLILHDGQGVFYEVPCTVIERYRVSEERAAELSGGADGASTAVPWAVRGGVFAQPSPIAHPPFAAK